MNRQKYIWLLGLLIVLLGVAGLARASIGKVIYLPLVEKVPTFTPTPTLRPSLTPTPAGPNIEEVFQSRTVGNPLDEYVSIRNYASNAVTLTGWFLRDDGTHRYDFPTGFAIAGGQTIRVWSKAGVDTSTDLFWNSPDEVWNDTEDCAYLRDNSKGTNVLVDVYCYKKTPEGILIIIRDPQP